MDKHTKVMEVINHPAFKGFGQFLFPAESGRLTDDMRLGEIEPLLWFHDNINSDTTVDVLSHLLDKVTSGEKVFYNIYTDAEKKSNPSKRNTGLFFFRGKPGAPFAIICAGGGFRYVGSIHESFPHALALSRKGYNAFTIQYRTDCSDADFAVNREKIVACEDLAAAISFIFKNTDTLQVSTKDYSVWGASAGARMAAYLGSYGPGAYGGDDLPRPGAVIMQYTAHSDYTENDPPTFGIIGNDDHIADSKVMQERINNLKAAGIDTEFHVHSNLKHGFGIGIGTVAEAWLDDALAFWERYIGK
jgi:acetyl esterase/lipase